MSILVTHSMSVTCIPVAAVIPKGVSDTQFSRFHEVLSFGLRCAFQLGVLLSTLIYVHIVGCLVVAVVQGLVVGCIMIRRSGSSIRCVWGRPAGGLGGLCL